MLALRLGLALALAVVLIVAYLLLTDEDVAVSPETTPVPGSVLPAPIGLALTPL
jgi:hypothetical protein